MFVIAKSDSLELTALGCRAPFGLRDDGMQPVGPQQVIFR